MKAALIEVGGWGGIWHYTCCLANSLHRQGLHTSVITSTSFEQPFKLGFHVFPVIKNNQNHFQKYLSVREALNNIKPSVTHVQSMLSARRDWTAMMYLRIQKAPLLITAHNLLPHDPEERAAPFMVWSFKCIYQLASKIIVHSEANRRQIQAFYGLPDRKVAIIPHGNYSFFAEKYKLDAEDVREHLLGQNAHKLTFLLFGAMRYYKGIDLALKAMSRLRELDKVHLIVAGKPYRGVYEQCEGLARDLRLSRYVSFFQGYLDDRMIAQLHLSADVLLFPYRDIFQSGSLQIALAFGKPIIASTVGSFRETLNERNAWLAESDSVTSLTEAMEKAIVASRDELLSMGRESLRLSRENHDWGAIAKQTIELYSSLI